MSLVSATRCTLRAPAPCCHAAGRPTIAWRASPGPASCAAQRRSSSAFPRTRPRPGVTAGNTTRPHRQYVLWRASTAARPGRGNGTFGRWGTRPVGGRCEPLVPWRRGGWSCCSPLHRRSRSLRGGLSSSACSKPASHWHRGPPRARVGPLAGAWPVRSRRSPAPRSCTSSTRPRRSSASAPARFYAVQGGVWFSTTSPGDPRFVAAWVPAAIYTIPPTSPLHHLTYVQVYDATPTTVSVGYTPGYLGTIVTTDGVVVYGTGY